MVKRMKQKLPKPRRRRSDWGIAIIAIVCSVVFGVAASNAVLTGLGSGLSNVSDGTNIYTGLSQPYIAKVKVVGEISSVANSYASSDSAYHHDWTLDTIDALIGDPNNKGIYFWLNTPGGSVYESDELYLKLMEYKEKTERPVYVYMGQMAASGGYYVAAASDGIYANRNTWTGSIGVTLGTIFDVSGFLKEYGIRTNTITSGQNKAMGSYFEPLTEDQRAIYQSLVDEAYDRFVSIVAQGRGLPENDVRTLADGRIYTAAQALEAGLIDEILGEKEAEEAIKAKFEDGIEISDCYYSPATNYLSFLGMSSSGTPGIFDLFKWGILGVSGDAAGFVGTPAESNDMQDASEMRLEGDVAAVLDLVQDQVNAGAPPLRYLYTG